MQSLYDRTLEAAKAFHGLGLVALPSRMDKKSPTISYSQYKTQPIPPNFYQGRHDMTGLPGCPSWQTTNLQLMCGLATSGSLKILVVDLDGSEAAQAWKRLCRLKGGANHETWIVSTGSGGKHIYYQLPSYASLYNVATRRIWGLWDTIGGLDGHEDKGGWKKHSEVKLIGDGGLAVAPPSRHVGTGGTYEWLGRHNPCVYAVPADVPAWLLAMPAVTAIPSAEQPAERPGRPVGTFKDKPGRVDRDDLLASLPPGAKRTWAQHWGLVITNNLADKNGWVTCHAIGRKDRHPSARFSLDTGVYHDFGTGQSLSFFDLAIALGAYKTFPEAVRAVAGSR